MIRTLAKQLIPLAIGAAVLQGSTLAMADSRVNHCDRFAKQEAIDWLASPQHMLAAREAAFALVNASTHGLNPADYDAGRLAADLAQMDPGNTSAGERVKFNRQFTRAVACYLQNVESGRLRPHALHKEIWLPRQKFDQSERLLAALQADTLGRLLDTAAPQSSDYTALRAQLAHLQDLARNEPSLESLETRRKVVVKVGEKNAIVPAVRARLTFLGDLSEQQPDPMDSIAVMPDSPEMEPALEAALVRFQTRHGLTPDGVLGPAALRALRVPMSQRVAQVELAMERIRWYPRNHGNRVVRVNIPAYTMSAMAPTGDGTVETTQSRVIVGKPGRRHTPLFAGPITRIEFSPYWFVPQSIAKRAILPTIRRNPNYVRERGFEFRLPNGKTTQRVTESVLDGVASNEVRLQQRSGKHNALGQVKFVLPNHRAIYLHDTNKRNLFARDMRALSYGCVRLEKPLALAELLLADQPRWNRAAIDKAVAGTDTVRARTSEATTVMLQYMTAAVDSDGRVRFLPDVYAMDKAALRPIRRWHQGIAPAPTDWQLLSRLKGLEDAA